MKRSKRIMSLLFAVLMLLSVIANPMMAYSAENGVVKTDVSVNNGETVTVKVTVPNAKDVSSGRVVVKYDNNLLTLESVTKDYAFDVDDMIKTEGSVDYAFASADAANLKGSVLTLKFKAAKVPQTDTTITTEIVELYNGGDHLSDGETVLEDTVKVGEEPFGTPTITSARSSYLLFIIRRGNIAWTPVKGAAGYELFRSTTRYGTYYRVADTRGTSYLDPILSNFYNYYYVVRAYKYVGGRKVYSDISPIVMLR